MLPNQKTKHVTKETIQPSWWLFDLKGQTLGRAATTIAGVLRGKHKALFSPHVDNGDFIVAINAEKVKLTGKKWDGKIYYSHSGFPGGIKSITAGKLMEKHPKDLITKAVKGMLPRNFLSRQIIKKLKVYTGIDHPHIAQNPQPWKTPSKRKQ
ncbi:MAG: 50S ribosomal protein L13 [Deltaproteobacteria bacterium]|nr:50S ribosomal protein L13 [Deltaproteobacteria bacterium]